MGLFKFLFGKKKKDTAPVSKKAAESDGQEQYLLDKESVRELPKPPIPSEKKSSPTIIPADKVKIEGSGGKTLKDARGEWVSKKSSNTVIKKVGGFVVSDEPTNKPAVKATPIQKAEPAPAKKTEPAPQPKTATATKKVDSAPLKKAEAVATVKVDEAVPKKADATPTKKAEPIASKKEATAPSKKPDAASKKTDAAPVKKVAVKPEVEPVEDGATEEGEVLESKATRSGKFELKKAKDGRFFFNLYASNHTVIAFSQIYSSSSSALNGIKSVMANAGAANVEDTTLKNSTSVPFPKWEIYIDRASQYRFRLYAANGNCVCHAAHGYATKSGCKGGIDSIIRFAAEARIDKKYLAK